MQQSRYIARDKQKYARSQRALTELKGAGANLISIGKTIMKEADTQSMILYRQGIKTGLSTFRAPTP